MKVASKDRDWSSEGVTEEKLQEEYRLLKSIYKISHLLCQMVVNEDYQTLSELLAERERLLNQARDMMNFLAPDLKARRHQKELAAQFTPLVEAIKRENETFLSLLQKKKESVLAKIQEAQQRKSLLVYSQ